MKNRKNWKNLMTLGVCFVLMTACGHAFHGGAPATEGSASTANAAPTGAIVSNLDLRLARAGSDPQTPDGPGDALPGISNATDLEVTQVIDLSTDPIPRFLAWDDHSALGSPIQEAHYIHRIQRGDNHLDGSTESFGVSLDSGNSRWYIPLNDLLGREPTSADGLEVHLLDLELVLRDGTRLGFKIRFRVMTPVASLQVTRLDAPEPTDLHQVAVGMISPDGFEVAAYRVANPSIRPLRVEIDRPLASIQVRSVLSQLVWESGHGYEQPHGVFHYFETRVPGEIVGATVCVDGALGCANQDLHAGGSVTLDLVPRGSAVVHWLIGKGVNAATCDIPAPGVQHVKWMVPLRTLMEEDRPQPFSLTGIEIGGSFPMRLSFTASAQGGPLPAVRQTLPAETVSASVGNAPAGEIDQDCQGLFRPQPT